MMHKQSVLKHGMGMAFGLLLTTGVPSFSSYAENVTVAVTQQSRTVSGTVVDEQGVPLLGVNVSVSGTMFSFRKETKRKQNRFFSKNDEMM